MTYVFTNPSFLDHRTGQHPENPGRLEAIAAKLSDSNFHEATLVKEWSAATRAQLGLVHTNDQLLRVEKIDSAGGGALDPDTILSKESPAVASLAVGAGINAVDRILSGETDKALCLVRPPGHHATDCQSMGFCIYNNIALAAKHALVSHELNRILIIDWDVHHGNGTQDIFYDNEQVFFFSMHRYPFYPGTGSNSETGTGRGLGFTQNMPCEYGISRRSIVDGFKSTLDQVARQFRPEIVMLSAGFDAHHADPVGSLGLEVEDFSELTRYVADLATSYCQGRLISFLEGGYNHTALAECVDTHLAELQSH